MLKQQFEELRLQTLLEYISNHIQKINCEKEKQFISSIIFGPPRVKIIPFDYNWNIKPDFIIVTNALIKLSSIIIELGIFDWKNKHSILIKNHCNMIYNNLKHGLIVHGCLNPPKKQHLELTPTNILDIAKQVLDLFYGQRLFIKS